MIIAEGILRQLADLLRQFGAVVDLSTAREHTEDRRLSGSGEPVWVSPRNIARILAFAIGQWVLIVEVPGRGPAALPPVSTLQAREILRYRLGIYSLTGRGIAGPGPRPVTVSNHRAKDFCPDAVSFLWEREKESGRDHSCG